MPVLTVPGAHINYETYGESGPWVTLVNGHTRSKSDFKIFGKKLAEAGFRVIALDNRGSGETTYDQAFTMQDMADDVVRLWDALHIETSHILGISMGGMICQFLAHQHPDRVSSLILISTAATPDRLTKHADSSWGESLESVKEKLRYYFSAGFIERNKLLVDAMAKQIWATLQQGTFVPQVNDQRRAMSEFYRLKPHFHIQVPTLIIHGEDDRIIGFEAAKDLAQAISQARLMGIPGGGHLLLAEAAPQLYSAAIDFFKTHNS